MAHFFISRFADRRRKGFQVERDHSCFEGGYRQDPHVDGRVPLRKRLGRRLQNNIDGRCQPVGRMQRCHQVRLFSLFDFLKIKVYQQTVNYIFQLVQQIFEYIFLLHFGYVNYNK